MLVIFYYILLYSLCFTLCCFYFCIVLFQLVSLRISFNYANKRECKAVRLKCGRGMDGWMFSRIYITAYRNAGLKKQTDLFFVAERSFWPWHSDFPSPPIHSFNCISSGGWSLPQLPLYKRHSRRAGSISFFLSNH